MKKTMWLKIGIPTAVLALLFSLPWITISFSTIPIPQIQYGEFPFRLEYEINGQRVVVEDTVICEYDGIGIRHGVFGVPTAKYIKWKQHLASNNNGYDAYILLLKISGNVGVYYFVGDVRFYMGIDDYSNEDMPYFHNGRIYSAAYIDQSGSTSIKADELLEKYGIKIISWEYSDPIVNTFK